MDIQDMIAELDDFYENAGFSDFYEQVLKDKTDIEIQQMFKETFSGEKELLEYAQSHGFDDFNEYDGNGGMLEKLQAFMAARAGGGDPEAQYLFGRHILDHSNAQVDVAWASEMISLAAGQGQEGAKQYLRDIGVHEESLAEPDDIDETELLLRAEAGEAEAQYQIGLSYMPGDDGEDADFSKALEWFAKAAENGHPMANNQLRMWTYVDSLMEKGELKRNAEFMEIMSFLISKAEAGDKEAQAVLA